MYPASMLRAAAVAAITLVATSAFAGGYLESASGDLSTDRLNPTPIVLTVGSNNVEGTSGFSATTFDRDYFSITLSAGQTLDRLVVGLNTVVGGGASFIGVQAGAQLTVDPDTVTSGAQLLGWHIFSSADKGTNILDEMGGGPDKVGFTGPLPAGTYTFWVQELAPRFFPEDPYPPYPYQFDLQVAAVPEPSTYAMLGLGTLLLGLGVSRGRRTR